MSGPERSTLSPGARFGSYEILQRLGSGGMGDVYRAKDTRLDREVAIKTLSLDRCSQPDALSRFELEARAASALNHPNIVTIYELGHENGRHYIAMELVDGETLRSLLSAGPIPFRKSVAIAAQIADGLAKAHEIGLIHRDLKPENLIISQDGTAKVLDFGLAKLLKPDRGSSDSSTTITEHGTVVGTVGYMSPEQATGDELDFRSDQFSFGSVLYEMATGTPAFKKKTHAETTAAILRDAPECLDAKTLQAPAPFIWIIERCLAKDPKQRYDSTRDLARDLAAMRHRVADIPPARESIPSPRNLPVQRTVFLGREREEDALRQLLSRADVHLLTLTGPGGIGKTRLALQVAGKVAEQFPGGVCFVGLAAICERDLIASAIVQVVGVRETGNKYPEDALMEYLGGLSQPMLLLLDNFEHLVAAAPVVAQMLTACPNLKVLVTSQAPLHIYGEHEYPVPPLELPDPQSLPDLEVLSRLPAITLFVERAQAVKHQFALTKENAVAVATICARLDGVPLAIELAAARIKLLPPSAILARLESRLNLLTGGARDVPTRQQTLRNTVEWSYSILNTAEQTLFRRLAVFAGGCTLESVEAVCDTKGDLGLDVFEGMASLVDKSLVQQVEHVDKETRFTMLSTIREYALERLAGSDDISATRRAHAAYYLVLAEEGAGDTQSEWLNRFDIEHENFRLAIDDLVVIGDAEWAMRLGTALFRFWETREHLMEGRTAIGKILVMEGATARPKLRARLLFAGAVLAAAQGDYESARPLFEESLDVCVKLNDKSGVAVALNGLAVNARDRGELSAASQLFEQCLGIWKEVGDATAIARALSNLGSVMKWQGKYERAFSVYEECLSMFRQSGDSSGVAWTLNYLGDLAREKADLAVARSYCEQSLSEFRRLHDNWGIASTLCDLASLSCDQGNNSEARRLYGEGIKLFKQLGYKRGIARAIECLAVNASAQSNAAQSLHLAGAAAALRHQVGVPPLPSEQRRLDKALEFARRTLGNAAGLSAWMEGWATPVEQAIKEGLHWDAAQN